MLHRRVMLISQLHVSSDVIEDFAIRPEIDSNTHRQDTIA